MRSWTFAYVGDMQPGSPRSYRFNPQWPANWQICREQLLELRPELLLVGGDLTRDGSIHRWELEEMKADLEGLPFPVYVIPGNMDTGNKHADRDGRRSTQPEQMSDVELNVTSDQLRQFSDLFGPLWWSFVHRNVRFSGCADMVINSGLPEEEDFWAWAEALPDEPGADHHVWLTHYPLFIEGPDEGNWDQTEAGRYFDWYFSIDLPGRDRLMALFRAKGVTLSIAGHIHCYKTFDHGGIRYVIAPSPAFPQFGDRWPDGDARRGFLRYDVDGTSLRETFVPLTRVSTAEGAYGPGGHPAPAARDYSLATGNGGERS